MLNLKNFFTLKQFSPNTEATYRFGLERLASWATENHIALEKLDEEGLQEFLAAQITWNHNSKYSAYCAIRAYFRWQYGDAHPVLAFTLKRKKTAPQRVIDADQLQAIIDFLREDTEENIRNRALIALMVDTGLRASEVCGLQTKHLHQKSKSCQAIIKGGEWGEAVYSKRTKKLLEAWLERRKPILLALKVPDPGTVFFSIKGHTPGKPMKANGLRCIFAKIAKSVGLEDGFSPHDLRRSFATISLCNGANPRLVQVGGRWKDIRLVERYSPKITARDMKRFFPMRKIE
jgi:site-specific recombinase XerD